MLPKIRSKDATVPCERTDSYVTHFIVKHDYALVCWTNKPLPQHSSFRQWQCKWVWQYCGSNLHASTGTASFNSPPTLLVFILLLLLFLLPLHYFFMSLNPNWKCLEPHQEAAVNWHSPAFVYCIYFLDFFCFGLPHLQFVSRLLPLFFSLASLYLFIFSPLFYYPRNNLMACASETASFLATNKRGGLWFLPEVELLAGAGTEPKTF